MSSWGCTEGFPLLIEEDVCTMLSHERMSAAEGCVCDGATHGAVASTGALQSNGWPVWACWWHFLQVASGPL